MLKNKNTAIGVLYAISAAMCIAIFISSAYMSFSCPENIRYFIIYLAIAVFTLAVAGIMSMKKD